MAIAAPSLARPAVIDLRPILVVVGILLVILALFMVPPMVADLAAGHPDWQPAYVYLALVGWLGQMVNAHLHHIGIRVLATLARGEDDETRPQALLTAPLSWATFGVYQAAVVLGAVGLLAHQAPAVALAGACGLLGWGLMGANLARAWRRARTFPAA